MKHRPGSKKDTNSARSKPFSAELILENNHIFKGFASVQTLHTF